MIEGERQGEFEQRKEPGKQEVRLTGERDWLIGLLSKERKEHVHFSHHCFINLWLPRLSPS